MEKDMMEIFALAICTYFTDPKVDLCQVLNIASYQTAESCERARLTMIPTQEESNRQLKIQLTNAVPGIYPTRIEYVCAHKTLNVWQSMEQGK
jgi:hypothetical protein